LTPPEGHLCGSQQQQHQSVPSSARVK
jgi:hypothetical protein